MNSISLYNLEDNTLITLHPKGLKLEVKKQHCKCYNLSELDFSIIYLLVLSRPNVVRFTHFQEVLRLSDFESFTKRNLQKNLSRIKRELKLLGINKFIINVKTVGYSISNIWVDPQAMNPLETERNKLRNLFKSLIGVATS